MLNAIIMASGFSSRMGTNKLLLPYKGKLLIEHILDKVTACSFKSVTLVAQNDEIIDIGKSRKVNVIHNERAAEGQSASIKLGIANSPECKGYAFFTADQPLIDIETIKLLIDSFYEADNLIIVPSFSGKRGAPVIFPEKFKSELLALTGDTGGKNVIAKHPNEVRFIEVLNESILWDIDTEEDYRKLIHN